MDTNVVVSAALLPRSVPRQAFDRALEHGTILISPATVAELNDVFRRPRFDKYVHEDERLEFLATLVRDAELMEGLSPRVRGLVVE
jgi:predicted nucleic acid-binding protein